MQRQPAVVTLPESLRRAIEESGALLRVGYPAWLRAVVRRNVIAITLGRRVYLSPRLVNDGEERVTGIVRHELAHVRQVRALGLARFLVRYVREYVANRRRGLDADAAYEAISFEVEARAAEFPERLRAAESVPDPEATL